MYLGKMTDAQYFQIPELQLVSKLSLKIFIGNQTRHTRIWDQYAPIHEFWGHDQTFF